MHYFASLSQAFQSLYWNKAHAEEWFRDQKVKPWTDAPRADAIEHFQAPRDGDQSCVDVLRYRFASNANIPTSKRHLELVLLLFDSLGGQNLVAQHHRLPNSNRPLLSRL
jgi:hypothetical protein